MNTLGGGRPCLGPRPRDIRCHPQTPVAPGADAIEASPAIARKVLENHKPGRGSLSGGSALTESAERIGSAQRAELDILCDFLRIGSFESKCAERPNVL